MTVWLLRLYIYANDNVFNTFGVDLTYVIGSNAPGAE